MIYIFAKYCNIRETKQNKTKNINGHKEHPEVYWEGSCSKGTNSDGSNHETQKLIEANLARKHSNLLSAVRTVKTDESWGKYSSNTPREERRCARRLEVLQKETTSHFVMLLPCSEINHGWSSGSSYTHIDRKLGEAKAMRYPRLISTFFFLVTECVPQNLEKSVREELVLKLAHVAAYFVKNKTKKQKRVALKA